MAKVKMLRVGSDKSISHRAAVLASVSLKKVIIKNYLFADDTINTIRALSQTGVDININGLDVIVNPKGKYSLKEPDDVLNMGNSGTGMRLLSGLLSGFDFLSVLTGDASLRKRPMMRIINPLRQMGAEILFRYGGLAPLSIRGKRNLNGIKYKQNIASAQVKSAILLAGLFSENDVCVKEPFKSRDHTENMLRFLGVDCVENNNGVCLGNNRIPLGDCEIYVPADISSSAFFVVLALLMKDMSIILKDIGLNETRSGILRILSQCEADYEILNRRVLNNEPIGDLVIKSKSELKPFVIDKEILPALIDEIPILSVLAIFCDGVSVVKDASELRKKESDRIKSICDNLKTLGVEIEEFEDGFKIHGHPGHKINPCKIETHKDHRIAMSFTILSAVSGVNLDIDGTQSIKTSYPGFFEHLSYILS